MFQNLIYKVTRRNIVKLRNHPLLVTKIYNNNKPNEFSGIYNFSKIKIQKSNQINYWVFIYVWLGKNHKVYTI